MQQKLSSPASSNVVSQTVLLTTRILSLLWLLAQLIWSVSTNRSYFNFLTNWSWACLLAYFLVAVTASLKLSRLQALQFGAFNALFAVAAGSVWIVSVGYWGLLHKDFIAEQNVTQKYVLFNLHVSNVIIFLLELFISTNELQIIGVLWPVSAIYVYAIMATIQRYAFGMAWPYSFLKGLLETSSLVTTISVVAIGLATAAFYFVSYGLILLRGRIQGREKKADYESQGTILELM